MDKDTVNMPTLSLDMSVLFDNAFMIAESLWPVLGLSAGFTLGFGILAMLLSAISKAVK